MVAERSVNSSKVFVSWRMLCSKYGSCHLDQGLLPVNKPANHILGIARSREEHCPSWGPPADDNPTGLSRGYT